MKERYEVLDGLRGVAALAVVGVHVLTTFFPEDRNPLHHAGLAVDFFFMLSGFVVSHAYDDRWGRMGLRQFFRLRLTRLHPLVLLGATLGLAVYLFDPFYPAQRQVGAPTLALVYFLAIVLLPAPPLANRTGQTHPLNGPSWSLTQEYLANVAYGLIGPRIGRRGLIALVAASAVALLLVGATHESLQVIGWQWSGLWMAPVRTAFPFFAGVLLQRAGARLKIPGGWVTLSLVLAALFVAPTAPAVAGIPLNGLVEAAVVIGVFPLVIAGGAAAEAKGLLGKLCRVCGEISYPIYIVHWPIVRLYSDWVWTRHPSHLMILAVGAPLMLSLPLIAWGALKLYDEPLRAWLSGRGRAPRQTLAGVGQGAPTPG